MFSEITLTTKMQSKLKGPVLTLLPSVVSRSHALCNIGTLNIIGFAL